MGSCIAVDIGGTKMLVAEVRSDGTIVNTMRFPTGDISRKEKMGNLIAGVRVYESQIGWENGKRPEQMGVGINDGVDPVKGIWTGYGEMDGEIPVAAQVKEALDVTCRVDNDVKCTVIAENEFGEGKHCRDMVYLNVGTGLAAGIISNRKLVSGSDGWAGEVGFMNFTGGEGIHVEMLASGMGIDWQARRMIAEYPDSILKQKMDEKITGQQVLAAEREGDALASHIINELVKMNGLMISNIVCLLSPEVVIVGGGLISGGLLERIQNAVLPKARQHLERGVVMTGLDPDYAGLMGAAALGLGYREKYM